MKTKKLILLALALIWAFIFTVSWLDLNSPLVDDRVCCTNWSCPYTVVPFKEMEANTNGTYKVENITLNNVTYDISGNVSIIWFNLSSDGCAHIHLYKGVDNIERTCKCLETK